MFILGCVFGILKDCPEENNEHTRIHNHARARRHTYARKKDMHKHTPPDLASAACGCSKSGTRPDKASLPSTSRRANAASSEEEARIFGELEHACTRVFDGRLPALRRG